MSNVAKPVYLIKVRKKLLIVIAMTSVTMNQHLVTNLLLLVTVPVEGERVSNACGLTCMNIVQQDINFLRCYTSLLIFNVS